MNTTFMQTHQFTVLFPMLIILAYPSAAQKFNFPLGSGDLWQYREPPPPPYDNDVIEARVISDTVLPNNKSYTLINWYNYGYPNPIWSHFYRQQSDTVFEYLLSPVNAGHTNEVIRYNFSKGLGDTVCTYADGSDTVVAIVIDTGMVNVAGCPTRYKTFFTGYKQSTMFWMDRIVDGLGLMHQEVEAGFELDLVGSIIDSVRLGTILSIRSLPQPLPRAGYVLRNYPNPFNPSTIIRYSIPIPQDVTITIYDVLGRIAGILAQGVRSAGTHTVTWEPHRLPSGVYFCRLQSPTFTITKAIVLQR